MSSINPSDPFLEMLPTLQALPVLCSPYLPLCLSCAIGRDGCWAVLFHWSEARASEFDVRFGRRSVMAVGGMVKGIQSEGM